MGWISRPLISHAMHRKYVTTYSPPTKVDKNVKLNVDVHVYREKKS